MFCILRTEWLWSLVIRVRKPDYEGYWLGLGSWVNQVLFRVIRLENRPETWFTRFPNPYHQTLESFGVLQIPLPLGKSVLENVRDGSSWTCLLSDRVMFFSNVHCKQSLIFLLSHTLRARVRSERRSLNETEVVACEQALCLGKGWKKREEREGKGWEPADK